MQRTIHPSRKPPLLQCLRTPDAESLGQTHPHLSSTGGPSLSFIQCSSILTLARCWRLSEADPMIHAPSFTLPWVFCFSNTSTFCCQPSWYGGDPGFAPLSPEPPRPYPYLQQQTLPVSVDVTHTDRAFTGLMIAIACRACHV